MRLLTMLPAPRISVIAVLQLLLLLTTSTTTATLDSTAGPLPAGFSGLFRRQSTSACYSLVDSACPGPDCLDATCSTTCTSAIPGLQACCDSATFNQFLVCVQQLDDPDDPSPTTSRSPRPARTSSGPTTPGPTTPFTPGTIAPITGHSTDLPGSFTSRVSTTSLVPSARPPVMNPSVMPISSASAPGSAGPTASATANAAPRVDQPAGWLRTAMQLAAVAVGALL